MTASQKVRGLLVASLTLTATTTWAAGGLDPSFGTGGKVTTDLGGSDAATAGLQLGDGKLLVVGGSADDASGQQEIALARYGVDGSLDASFGVGGIVRTNVTGLPENLSTALLIPGSKVQTGGGGKDFVLRRFHLDGSVDATFGNGGRVSTDFGTDNFERVVGMILQPDGKVVACGDSGSLGGTVPPLQLALARYEVDGTLDASFGTFGKIKTNIMVGCRGIARQSDGKLVIAGYSPPYYVLARYELDGTLDPTFGSGGISRTLINGSPGAPGAIEIAPDGRILVVGTVGNSVGEDIAAVRYLADGSLDPSFGTGGVTTIDIATHEFGMGLALQADGRIVVIASNVHEFEVVRLESEGTFDASFGKQVTFVGSALPFDVLVQTDQKIVVVGFAEGDWALARYVQTAACGDGGLDAGETCDDGGVAAGDCCSPTCDLDPAGTACDDANPCTDTGQCNASGTCVVTNNSAPCDDNVFCNGADTCAGGTCSVHAGDPCPGGPECRDVCNEAADACLSPVGAGCADDGNSCTDDRCDGAGSCVHPPNTAACDDGDPCTSGDTCSGGACLAGTGCPVCEVCQSGIGCAAFERADCKTSVVPSAGLFQMTSGEGFPGPRTLSWQWNAGAATSVADFGDPIGGDPYTLCLFDDSAAAPRVLLRTTIAPVGLCHGRPCWTPVTGGFTYKDTRGLQSTVRSVLLRSGASGAAKIALKSKGPIPTNRVVEFPLALPVRVQLYAEDGQCWDATYSAARTLRNTSSKFKARND